MERPIAEFRFPQGWACECPSTLLSNPRGFPVLSVKDFCSLSDAQLANCDPIMLNLVVARELPELAGLDVGRYQRMADAWVRAFARWLPTVEGEFRKTPWDWKIDVRARCYRDKREPEKARRDYLLAHQLFPQSRFLATKYEEVEGGVYSRY
jgi:hypothetical protein